VIADDLRAVKERIERAAIAAKRDPASVKLVAVSKTKPPEAIREAYAAGQRAFGENYAQELESKAAALADLEDLEWHFIGPLQTNKAKIVAKVAHVIHTVHKADLAKELEKRLSANDRTIDALVEVNVSGEAQKHGAAPSDVASVLASIESCPHLRLRGLMTMPPADDDDEARRAFDGLRALRDSNGGAARLRELSMGMSDDLEIAIACGATLVRVGTAVFGARS
jgi:pyridoxal phosphate enzyme (YggS family)